MVCGRRREASACARSRTGESARPLEAGSRRRHRPHVLPRLRALCDGRFRLCGGASLSRALKPARAAAVATRRFSAFAADVSGTSSSAPTWRRSQVFTSEPWRISRPRVSERAQVRAVVVQRGIVRLVRRHRGRADGAATPCATPRACATAKQAASATPAIHPAENPSIWSFSDCFERARPQSCRNI